MFGSELSTSENATMAKGRSQINAIVSVLRIHRRHQHPSAPASEPVDRLVEAVHRALSWSRVIVAFDAADVPLSQAISARPELKRGEEEATVALLPVQPWNFTAPLNASIIHARTLEASKIAFVSLEMTVTVNELSQILNLWSKETLVIGKALDPHSFREIQSSKDCEASVEDNLVELTGLTSPWNTFAIWDLSKLAKTGFLALSDTNVKSGQSAIEEVPIIALHQYLFPDDSEAILVRMADFNASTSGWDTNWNDPQRASWQRSKLATKNLSAASHLQLLALHPDLRAGPSSRSRVRHVDLSCPK